MTSPPVYIQRIARLPEVLAILSQHPRGLPLDQVAAELDVEPERLREEILLFYVLEVPDDPAPPETIEFLAQDGEPAEPFDAPIIRLAGGAPQEELGVQYLSANELAVLYRAAIALLELDPEDKVLESAVGVLEDSLLDGLEETPSRKAREEARLAALLDDAIEARRVVRLRYTRAWEPGTRERDVEPYLMAKTRRGWELDAASTEGPEDGHPRAEPEVRTYLLSGITDLQVLDSRFERRPEVEARIDQDRTEVPVDVLLPMAQLWVAQRFAERIEVLSADAVNEDSEGEPEALVRAHVIAPVRQRLGLMLLIAGDDAYVHEPEGFDTVRAEAARTLLEHHREPPGPFVPVQSAVTPGTDAERALTTRGR